MANTKAFLINAGTRHAVFVNRFSSGQVKQMMPYLTRVKRATAGRLIGGNLTDFSKKRLEALYTEINGISKAAYDAMGKELTDNMAEFAQYETKFNTKMYTKATTVDFVLPTANQITAAIFVNPMRATGKSKNINIADALDQFGTAKAQQVVNLIQDGVIAGQTNDEIIKALDYVIDTTMANNLRAIVSSITSQISQDSRDLVMSNNSDITDGYQWVATLDDLCCIECGALDGETFAEDDDTKPQLHWNCRCTTVPLIKPEFNIVGEANVDRPAIGEDGAQQGVSAKTTYGDWLAQQSAAFQDEALGPTRGALFRDGGLDIKQFVDSKNNTLTLDQLQSKEPLAFKDAGID